MTAEPTPRTEDFLEGENPDMLTWVDFARQLERELSLAQSRLAEVEKGLQIARDHFKLIGQERSVAYAKVCAAIEAIKRSSASSQS